MEKEDEEISIDFGKIKNFFKSDKEDKKAEAKSPEPKAAEEKKETDEEISIDFGKIKSFFKSDEKEQHSPEHKKEEHPKESGKQESDDELTIDFSKVKKIFKSSEGEKSDDDINIDWSKSADLFKKYGVILLALIPVVLSIYIRMQAGYLGVTDDWAANSVISNLRENVRNSIDQQYPNLPDANKDELVSQQLQKVITENKPQIDQQVVATSNYFRSFFLDPDGKNYMPDIDPYYFYRYAKNIVDRGHPGDELRNGIPYDTYQLAPRGRPVTPDYFPEYFLAYFYKVLHVFSPDLSVLRSVFYYPIFLSAICVLLVFLIARRFSGNFGGMLAGLMMAVNTSFLGRTLFGHADSDAFVVIFPLLITWLIVLAEDMNEIWKVALVAGLAGFSTGLFSLAWIGWWFIFDFLLITLAATFFYLSATNFSEIRKDRKFFFSNRSLRNLLIIGVVYFVASGIFTTAFFSFKEFSGSYFGPLGFKSLKAPSNPDLWPNVLTTVAELNEGSIGQIIGSAGGKMFFYIGLMGLVLAAFKKEKLSGVNLFYVMVTLIYYAVLVHYINNLSLYTAMTMIVIPIAARVLYGLYKKDDTFDFRLPLLLSMWIVFTMYASIKGIRFTILLAPAFSVAFGVALGQAYNLISLILTKELKIHKFIANGMLAVLILMILIAPIKGAYAGARSDIPIINDAWYDALTAIKQDSNKQGIITSWWDFGHHFKVIADTPVTFDGTTQGTHVAHWVGKLFMISDEKEAIGILRMLDCGNSMGFSLLEDIKKDVHSAVRITNKIIMQDKEAARKILLKEGLTAQQADDVLKYTHCDPPKAYVIASEDMIGKSGVWSHFGSWNFERADIWYNARKMPMEEAVDYMIKKFNYTKDKAENIYYDVQSITSDSEANTWIAPWPSYAGVNGCTKNKEGVFECSNGILVNMSNHDVFARTNEGIKRPVNAAFVTETGIDRYTYNGTTIGFGATIIPQNDNQMQLIMSSEQLTGSIFTRLFYLQGHGLKYFKPFNHQRGLTGTDIFVYKVDWEGKNTTIVSDYVKKPVEEGNITAVSDNETNGTNNSK